jgi:uncharacterized repeat protein (TIGR03803 family)
MKTRFVLCLLFLTVSSFGQTYVKSTLYNFPTTSKKDPISPQGLVVDSSGNVYGVALAGGKNGGGALFKVTAKGVMTVLYNFAATAKPTVLLVRDSAGNLYGTGAIGTYKVTAAGKESVLSNAALTTLTLDTAGNLYGYFGQTLVRLTPKGALTTLYTFCNGGDGCDPIGALVLDKSGNLYGTCESGGEFGMGTAFQVNSFGEETVIYNFTGDSAVGELGNPVTGLIENASGQFYGADEGGSSWAGEVFTISPSWVESSLYSFGDLDGEGFGNMALDSSGDLFILYAEFNGSDEGCDENGVCTDVVLLTPSDSVSFIFSTGPAAIAYIALDKGGNVYGTQPTGGPAHNGSIFKLTKSN